VSRTPLIPVALALLLIAFSGQTGPSFASIVDVPEPGCWRLDLSTGQLRASLVLLAITPAP
jgi:hypothetical protein